MASISEVMLEEWSKEIARWVNRRYDNLFARNAFAGRKVDDSVQIDVVVEYTKTGTGAQVVAKGSVPTNKTGIKATTTKQDIFQLMDNFDLNEKDLSSDPSLFNKLVNVCMKNIHRLEDNLVINGDTNLNMLGIAGAAAANSMGQILTTGASGDDANNKGAWNGSESNDPHADIIEALGRLGDAYDPAYLVGNRKDLLYLFNNNSQEQPIYETIAPLFGKSRNVEPMGPGGWMLTNGQFARGKVYLIAKDDTAAELVVSTNPYPDALPKQRGGNYPVELKGWSVPRIYDNDAFVEIAIG